MTKGKIRIAAQENSITLSKDDCSRSKNRITRGTTPTRAAQPSFLVMEIFSSSHASRTDTLQRSLVMLILLPTKYGERVIGSACPIEHSYLSPIILAAEGPLLLIF